MATPGFDNGQQAVGGRNGKVVINSTEIYRSKQWTVNAVTSESAWGDSGSGAYTFRKAARLDATGSVVGVMDEAERIYGLLAGTGELMLGKAIVLSLWEVYPTPTRGWHFPCAIIQGLDLTVDMDSKEVIEWTMNWGSDGVFYRPGQTGASLELVT